MDLRWVERFQISRARVQAFCAPDFLRPFDCGCGNHGFKNLARVGIYLCNSIPLHQPYNAPLSNPLYIPPRYAHFSMYVRGSGIEAS